MRWHGNDGIWYARDGWWHGGRYAWHDGNARDGNDTRNRPLPGEDKVFQPTERFWLCRVSRGTRSVQPRCFPAQGSDWHLPDRLNCVFCCGDEQAEHASSQGSSRREHEHGYDDGWHGNGHGWNGHGWWHE